MKTRKPYAPPTLTVHGDAVARTAGMAGKSLELINFRPGPPFPRPGPGGPFDRHGGEGST